MKKNVVGGIQWQDSTGSKEKLQKAGHFMNRDSNWWHQLFPKVEDQITVPLLNSLSFVGDRNVVTGMARDQECMQKFVCARVQLRNDKLQSIDSWYLFI